MKKPLDYSLYLVTDQHCLSKNFANNLEKAVEQAILGGVKIVQLREKTANSRTFFDQAERILAICRQHNVPLLINDRMDIALAVGADGVHLGQSDLPADVARQLLGDDKIIGVSARTVTQAQKAKQDGADYLGIGAVFGTTTKDDAKVIDLATIKQINQAVDLPIILIGGINNQNLSMLKENIDKNQLKISGFAVVSAILQQDDIYQASKNLLLKIST
ncbi:thiamine phosphate synthase [Faucicola mancuniensis]|uniref:thiamine phosphate synthase n=1 Tax=Faucicola mancuniensis TaxID=1309795 RepID=UPI00397767C3